MLTRICPNRANSVHWSPAHLSQNADGGTPSSRATKGDFARSRDDSLVSLRDRKEAPNDFPMPHKDMLRQVINYRVK